MHLYHLDILFYHIFFNGARLFGNSITFSEEEYGMECEGASSTETAEDGSLIITREETGVLTYQEDELGEIIFRSTLTIQ